MKLKMHYSKNFVAPMRITVFCTIAVLLHGSKLAARHVFAQDASTRGASENGDSLPADDAFARITPPLAIKSIPFEPEDDSSKEVLRVTNRSKKPISRTSTRIILVEESGKIQSSFAASNDRWFGLEQRNELKPGKEFTIELAQHHFKPGVSSVSGLARSVTWKDGSKWPVWAGPTPRQEGTKPVSIRMKGIVVDGDFSAPLLEFFNHGDKRIDRLEFRVLFSDRAGVQLNSARRTRIGGIDARQGIAYVGEPGVPKAAVRAELILNDVTFDDGSKWTAKD